ncbi:MAG: manganese catalase family protein [Clostridia bacterium]|nr:manganese catalase family protein [Clostridia bacterium]
MWNYEKRLQYPVRIKKPDGMAAKIIITQFGGPDGELAASQRYLSQRYSMPYGDVAGLLTDIGTEELAHVEMICAIVRQLTKDLTIEQIEEAGLAPYFVDHTVGLWPQSAGGVPFSATVFQSKGDPITDLTEDLAADGTTLYEQTAFSKCRKPLILLGFCHFSRSYKPFHPATAQEQLVTKNNQNHDRTSCFQEKSH